MSVITARKDILGYTVNIGAHSVTAKSFLYFAFIHSKYVLYLIGMQLPPPLSLSLSLGIWYRYFLTHFSFALSRTVIKDVIYQDTNAFRDFISGVGCL
jgi:hypothetical protein